MRLLDCFSGTGSVAKAARSMGWETVTLDLRDADINCNILQWNYRAAFEPGHFDVIWGSPPCQMFSRARTTAKTPRDIEGSCKLVSKFLEIVEYLQPRLGWFMENPQSGLLCVQPVVQHLSFKDLDYCQYGYLYRKRTRIWHSEKCKWQPRPLCDKKKCHAVRNGRHLKSAQRGPCKGKTEDSCSLSQLHSIPPDLIKEILLSVDES
jgi:hypothetical protein